jgi:hypothetical protein
MDLLCRVRSLVVLDVGDAIAFSVVFRIGVAATLSALFVGIVAKAGIALFTRHTGTIAGLVRCIVLGFFARSNGGGKTGTSLAIRARVVGMAAKEGGGEKKRRAGR